MGFSWRGSKYALHVWSVVGDEATQLWKTRGLAMEDIVWMGWKLSYKTVSN